ncbi:P-loop containing nucleoside triphosphate hydrolases superfamily protein [Wolffia australiana]
MMSSRGGREDSAEVFGGKRGKNRSSSSRAKKKQKRLDAICDSLAVSSPNPSTARAAGSAVKNDEDSPLRRSTRVRKATVFVDFSPEPYFPKSRRSVKREIDFSDVPGSSRLRRSGRKSAELVGAAEEETDPPEEADRVDQADDHCSDRVSDIREVQSVALDANENHKEDDPGEDQAETLRSVVPDSHRETLRRKINRRKSRKRDRIPQVPKDAEEHVSLEISPSVREIPVLQSGDKEEDSKTVFLVEKDKMATEGHTEQDDANTCKEDLSRDECERGVIYQESLAEFVVQSTPEEAAVTDELQKLSGKTPGDTTLASEEALLEERNASTVGNIAIDGLNSPEKDLEKEEHEASTVKASPEEPGIISRDKNSQVRSPVQLRNRVSKDRLDVRKGTHDYQRIREGRRCGLCGGGTDGKPPKKIVLASIESDEEQYNGSSSSEEPTYDVWDGFGDDPDWLGRLLGPSRDRFGIARVWVHQQCAVWSPEVYFAGPGRLKNVRAALCRGKALKCSRCGRPGATIGCRVDRCPKTYHLPCARAENSIFDHRKFLIACSDHRHHFQPQGQHYLQRVKKMKKKKMRLDMKKQFHEALRKDLEAEDKWLENCGEDEEFLKREGKRLHRDLMRITPVFIGGHLPGNSTSSFQGWESVAGLKDVIQCLKEVVILPLLYPEVFSSLSLTPPRGVLLHGYPGTGKTHVVRALIGECSRGGHRIAYFARKGADCLGKYVGDAERQLRLLFQVAEKSQPSIIFFDEIDGLAPSRSRRQDQTHNSVVATLLSLLDGLKSRGSVVVIGATNRPDAVDPALRRPGRFDREIYFPLPSVKDRSEILSLHTKNWPKPLEGSLLSWIAKQTAGYAGADLQALCTQAAMIALKRNCPLHDILQSAEESSGIGKLPPLPFFSVDERDWLSALASASPPCSRREAGMAANEVVTAALPSHLTPCLLLPLCHLLIRFNLEERIWLPLPLLKASKVVKDMVFSALKQTKKPVNSWKTHLKSMVENSDMAMEIERHLSLLGLLSSSTMVPEEDKIENLDSQRMNAHGSLAHSFSNSPTTTGFHGLSGFRVLITGTRRSGQRHLVACLLEQFVGHVEIQKVSLSTISQEGHGDIVLGITQILSKCMNGGCVVYLPKLDLWAFDVDDQLADDESACQKTEEASGRGSIKHTVNHPSVSWNSFVEHMNSMHGSSSLVVLATCEMATDDIPDRVKAFFTAGMVDGSKEALAEHTIPRFFVEIDGNIDHAFTIRSSVSRIMCDVVKEYIQWIHRGHSRNMTKEKKIIQERVFPKVNHDIDPGKEPSNGGDSCLVNRNMTLSRGPFIGTTNNSSTYMIAAFGYQILQYPQFAELCWATSRIKEGPSADVSGPWKVWPFNSCIVRPHKTADKPTPLLISKNSKSNEISGVVRGLVAVGLLAYRGSYNSVKEVSSQVRTVLELLVGLISEKILSGKDMYRYSRILSQVAYMEDLVNSWTYSILRSSGKTEDNYTKEKKQSENLVSEDAPEIKATLLNEVQEVDTIPTAAEETSRTELSVPSSVPDTPIMDQSKPSDLNQQCNLVGEEVNLSNPNKDDIIKNTFSENLCLYTCCSGCLQSIQASVQDLVQRSWEAAGQRPTVEQVHDITTLCSLSVVSAMRKHFLSLENVESATEFSSRECSRHSCENPSGSKPGLKFLFRDGTLSASDPPEGAKFSCSFAKLCVESVAEMVSSVTVSLG